MIVNLVSKTNPFVLSILLLMAFESHALAKNPGRSASACVRANGSTVTNNCSEKVFVIWCGDLKYSKKKCGDGPNGGFYTHSENLQPGQSKTLEIIPGGTFKYASCIGSISFGNEGAYTDTSNGSYHCLPK